MFNFIRKFFCKHKYIWCETFYNEQILDYDLEKNEKTIEIYYYTKCYRCGEMFNFNKIKRIEKLNFNEIIVLKNLKLEEN